MSNSKKMITQIGKIVGQSINAYYPNKLKSKVDEVKFKETYQGRIIDCMVGEVDDNYIETPETDAPVVKLEHSKEGVVKIPSIKGKTILVDADGQITDTPGEGCRLVSVGEDEENKLIILSKNKNLHLKENILDGLYVDGTTSTFKQVNGAKSVFIKVEKNTEYIFSFDKEINRNVVGRSLYAPKKDDICEVHNAVGAGKPYTYRVNSGNYNYITFYYNNAPIDVNIQIEKNSNPTTYVEPKYHKTEILLNEPLRSLSNGVCDEIIGNQLIRRIGVRPRVVISDIGVVDINVVN